MGTKRNRHIILKGLLFAAVLFACLFLFRWFLFDVVHKDDVLSGMVELRRGVMQSMEEGNETDIFYVKDIKIHEIRDINLYVDSAFGDVVSYRALFSSGNYLMIQFHYDKSDNYYVVRKVLYDEDIPQDKERAQAIYQAYLDFKKNWLKEPMTDYNRALALHDYLVSVCSYGYPEHADDAYDAYGVLVEHKGVCDGYAEAFFLFSTCMGIDCDIVVGTASDQLHAWNQIKLGESWYHVDVTWDDPLPDTGDGIRHSYFNLTDDILSYNHNWEKDFYNKCDNTTFYYYQKECLIFYNYEDFENGMKKMIGRDKILECILYGQRKEDVDLSFLYERSFGVKSISYNVEEFSDFLNITVYIN